MRTRTSPSLHTVRLAVLALLLTSCGGGEAPTGGTPAPTPDPTPTPGLSTEVVVGDRTGPTEITFIAADAPPGSSLSGCGDNASGCSGQIRMRFRLLSGSGGQVLRVIGFLHANSKLACLTGSTGPFTLEPGEPHDVIVVYDQPDPDVCDTPTEVVNMKAVVSGSIEVSSLQEWAIEYAFLPGTPDSGIVGSCRHRNPRKIQEPGPPPWCLLGAASTPGAGGPHVPATYAATRRSRSGLMIPREEAVADSTVT